MTSTASTLRRALCMLAACALTTPARALANHDGRPRAPTSSPAGSPAARDPARAASQAPPTPAAPASGGFDWPSAGIGAATLGALLLVGHAAAGAARRVRNRATA